VGDRRSALENLDIVSADVASWRDRSVLVTGAAGLLGGEVVRQLIESGARTIGLDSGWHRLPPSLHPAGMERVDGDIRDPELLFTVLETGVDTVIHLAAQTLVGPALEDPAGTFSNNIEGTWIVLEACRAASSVDSVVVASSDKAYGDWSGRPYRESMGLKADRPYDVSKAAADMLARTYGATYHLPIAVTRCANLYGPGDTNWSRVVPGTIRSVIEGARPVIRSDGRPVRDYLHVRDGARATLALATAVRSGPELRGRAFNVAARTRASVIDVVRLILVLMDSQLVPDVLALDLQELPSQRVSAAEARRVLGWRPVMRFRDGLSETIDWYRAHLADVT
jgi:CDP-glucose 4,6-dehydratase